MSANTAYIGEIVARRNNELSPSFKAYAFSAYCQTRYAFREKGYAEGMRLLAEYERIHSGDSFYWTYRRLLADFEVQAPVIMQAAA